MGIDRINPAELGRPSGFSHVVSVTASRLAFLAGQTALDAGGQIVGSGVVEQFERALGNLLTALRAAGGQPADLVSVTVYAVDLDDYRGHVVVIGVWAAGLSEPTANLDRLYKAFGPNPKFRFLGVSNQRSAKPANTTFPAVYNQGSKLFGALPGEFVLLDENGSIERRGSLVKDFNSLQKELQGK